MLRKSTLDSLLSGNSIEDDVMLAFQEQEFAEAAEEMALLVCGLFRKEVVTYETVAKVLRMKKILIKYEEDGYGYDELSILMKDPEDIDEELSFSICTWFVKELLTDDYIVEKIGKCSYEQLINYLESRASSENKAWCKRVEEMENAIVFDGNVYYLKPNGNKTYTLYQSSTRDGGGLLELSSMSTELIADGLSDFLHLDRERKYLYAKCAKEDCYVECNLVTGDTTLCQPYEVPWMTKNSKSILFANEEAMENAVWKMIVSRSLRYKYPEDLAWLVQELNLIPTPEVFRRNEIISLLDLLQSGNGSRRFIQEVKNCILKCEDDEMDLCMKLFSRYEDEIAKHI